MNLNSKVVKHCLRACSNERKRVKNVQRDLCNLGLTKNYSESQDAIQQLHDSQYPLKLDKIDGTLYLHRVDMWLVWLMKTKEGCRSRINVSVNDAEQHFTAVWTAWSTAMTVRWKTYSDKING